MIGIEELAGALFDTDGVLTDTAALHAMAWKAAFDDLLRGLPPGTPEEARAPFEIATDYPRHVDGRSREDGVRVFLASRDLRGLDPAAVTRLAERKDRIYLALLRHEGAVPRPGAVALLAALRGHGVPTAVVSASRHCAEVVAVAGLTDLFDTRVDGLVAAQLGLAGKPDPALFLEAARRLGAEPGRTMVVEDALVGVQAGRRGGFAPVVGVDRGAGAGPLLANGAEVVVGALTELPELLGL
ncbi:HAD family hydrolase [Streptacidiphilus jiangxiensis]|uniref:Haloacid dehalogenase superfamily, subfamily IA, variant 3 with third motif having DD or ED n=1 Tax=Streptacidiphilus jiangxiensis TaxID=235985 RepID=A0A1H7QVN4_STRJI|nr:HAD-IA family hydrolase [Streptacidiphilus jiangxiensis]SEL51695.1 haloacid dehalogenase superfamily, subfamily IA, variant 3 with third motif having DD or ED [Streptacidiphilus jiangxiensis]